MAYSLGEDQPFRYRGYVYDSDTQLYYLQSRYYDPKIGRFISADVLLSTGQGVLGHNSFAYCLNNPLNKYDYDGLASEDYNNIGNVGVIPVSSPFPNIKEVGKSLVEAMGYVLGLLVSTVFVKSVSDTIAEADRYEPVYYGAIVENDSLLFVTGPMNYYDAKIWVVTIGLSEEINIFDRIETLGPKRKWGLYTQFCDDAYDMAYDLGEGEPIGPECSSATKCYYHFHVKGRLFLQRYEHFHVWFGSLG